MSFRSKTLAVLAATALAGCLAGCGGPSPADQVVKALEGMGFKSVRYSGSQVKPITVSLTSVTAVTPTGLPFTASHIHADRTSPDSEGMAWTRFQVVSPTLGSVLAGVAEIEDVVVEGDRTRHGSIVMQDVSMSGPWGSAKAARMGLNLTDDTTADIAFQKAEIAANDATLQPLLKGQSWTGILGLRPLPGGTDAVLTADSGAVAVTSQARVPGGIDRARTLAAIAFSTDWMRGIDLGSLAATVRIVTPVEGLDLADRSEDPNLPPDGGMGRTVTGTLAPDAKIPLASLVPQWKEALAGKPGPLVVRMSERR